MNLGRWLMLAGAAVSAVRRHERRQVCLPAFVRPRVTPVVAYAANGLDYFPARALTDVVQCWRGCAHRSASASRWPHASTLMPAFTLSRSAKVSKSRV